MGEFVSRQTSVLRELRQRGHRRLFQRLTSGKGDKRGVKCRWAKAGDVKKYCLIPASSTISLVKPSPSPSSIHAASFQLTSSFPIPWHLYTKATQRGAHTPIENRISMSLPWPWGEVSNISFQGDNDSSFNSPYFTVYPNEYTAWVILIEHQPASGIMTLTVLSRFDDLMTMDLLIYPEICSTSFIKT